LPLPEAEPNPLYILVSETGIQPERQDHLGLAKGPEWEEMIYAQFNDGTKDIASRPPESFKNSSLDPTKVNGFFTFRKHSCRLTPR